MINIFAIGTGLLFLLSSFNSLAQQKKVTVLGSSTAAGTGASVPDSSWVGKLRLSFKKNPSDGKDTIVNNRAVGGYVTYKSLPTGYSHPADRPDPDPNANVTYVLNDLPRADVVIINYPTNDIASGYTAKEMMDNLRLMYQQFTQNGIRCYITTSQPRNLSDDQRVILRQLVDSIQLNFTAFSINFWDDIAATDGSIKPEVNSGDGIHVNDLGHRLLFQRVQAKNILSGIAESPLPVTIKNWQASFENKSVKLSWSTAFEEGNTYFEIQRSMDGNNFQTLYRNGGVGRESNYSWTDLSPFNGKNFYRLKIIETDKTSYSRIIPIINDVTKLITSLYTDGAQLYVQLNANRNQSIAIAILNFSGSVVKQESLKLNSPNTATKISISELASGHYYVRVANSNGSSAVERFVIMK
jgi:lysophospholipase L1-like esterase